MATSTTLTFGAELECFLPIGMSHRRHARSLARSDGLHAQGRR